MTIPQLDQAELLQLADAQQALAGGLQAGHQGGDAVERARPVGVQLGQGRFLAPGQLGFEFGDAHAQRQVIDRDGAFPGSADPPHQQVESVEQRPGVQLAEIQSGQLLGIIRHLLAELAADPAVMVILQAVEDLGGVFKGAKREQPPDQVGSGIVEALLFGGADPAFRGRGDGPCLQFQQ